MIQRTILKRVQVLGGAKLRRELPKFVNDTAAALQKRVCERAQELEPSGDPADVVSKAALAKSGYQRTMLLADYHAYLAERDGRCGREVAEAISTQEIDRHIAESQPVIEMFERDLLDVVTLAVVEFRAARNTNAPNA